MYLDIIGPDFVHAYLVTRSLFIYLIWVLSKIDLRLLKEVYFPK